MLETTIMFDTENQIKLELKKTFLLALFENKS